MIWTTTAFDSRKKIVWVASVAAFTLILPFLLNLANVNLSALTFDTQLPVPVLQKKIWFVDVIVVLVFVSLVCGQFSGKLSKRALATATLILALISELFVSRLSLPPTPSFDFIKTPAHQYLMHCGERVSPLGFDLLAANTNTVFGIRSLAHFNAMFLKRYAEFMRAADGHVDEFNVLLDVAPVSYLLDLSSLKYVISLNAVLSPEEQELQNDNAVSYEKREKFGEDVVLESSTLAFNPRKREIRGTLKWSGKPGGEDKYFYVIVVSNLKGVPFWFGSYQPCFVRPEGKKRLNVSAFLPANVQPSESFRVGVKVFDMSKKEFVPRGEIAEARSSVNPDKARDEVVLAQWQYKTEVGNSSADRFRLVKELPGSGVRIYENTSAMPQAYLVNQVKTVETGSEALNAIKSAGRPSGRTAVIEIDGSTWAPQSREDKQLFARPCLPSQSVKEALQKLSRNTAGSTIDEKPDVQRPNPNRIVVDCKNESSAFLVLTELFYPGWVATVDGVETPIYCTNYAFRGLPLSPGRHKVVFEFRPVSFTVGVWLALGTLAVIFLRCLWQIRRNVSRPAEITK